MSTTSLGFAAVILSGIAIAPLLVQTDQASRQPVDLPVVAATGGCALAIERMRSATDVQPHPTMPDCLPAAGLLMASAH
jgi:hypothetical protein